MKVGRAYNVFIVRLSFTHSVQSLPDRVLHPLPCGLERFDAVIELTENGKSGRPQLETSLARTLLVAT